MLRAMNGDVPHPFVGELIRLRAREREDLPILNPLFNDPDVLEGVATVTFPQPLESITAWYERTRAEDDSETYVIETLESEDPIGVCSLMSIEARTGTAELGIWIAKPHWNRGFGTDAVRTLSRFGIRFMNLHRITLHVLATNAKAIRAYEKACFRHEGALREAASVNGHHVDLVVMGLLANDLE